jgi:DTW domain-containing protein YfiP
MVKPINQRDACFSCNRIKELCLCSHIRPFEIEPLIVQLVHPKEVKRTIGTFRIVKLSLTNSIWIRGWGEDFDQNQKFLSLVNDPNHYPMILYPGEDSLNLSTATREDLSENIPQGKRLVIFVIDGTWATAKQMIQKSKIIQSLPKVSFEVKTPSIYEFRKQPEKFCLSTVEAVSVLIENLKQKGLCTPFPENAHQHMLQSFKVLVAEQVERINR